jgi:hypothetical protein
MANFDMAEVGVVDESVVHRQGAHTRDAEQHLHFLGEETLH